ncbi:hypothetical protein acdb102_24210 [Acidothermaceae bacterium B102]|nr:hypothetical protein acdb102_24210 [Acidothermaceae bacterium B102]
MATTTSLQAWAGSPWPGWSRGVRLPLTVAACLSVAALVVAVAGVAVDRTSITGAPAWLKPAKFGVSIAFYCGTLAWMLSYVRGHDSVVRAIAWTTAVCLVLELMLIDVQVLRGTTSHFNVSTPFDATVVGAMGALVIAVFVATVVAAVLLLRQGAIPGWLSYGIGGGLVVTLLGMAEAVLMVANTRGHSTGGHTVGGPDGGPGLPLLGWSTEHGDLRVAHFVGLHALQLIPLLAWALHTYLPDTTDHALKRLIVLGTVAYAGVVVLLAWQAERGQPLLRPDRVTLSALGVGAVATLAVALRVA